MKPFPLLFLLLIALALLPACTREAQAPGVQATDTIAPTETTTVTPQPPTAPPPTSTATVAPPTEPPATATVPPPAATATVGQPGTGGAVEITEEEAIRILTPGNGSRITGAITVQGEADPTFEQSLSVRIVTIDGEQMALQPATIAADLGERGPFEVQMPVSVQEETQAWIQVYATSARDGGITHLNSVAVTLAPDGETTIREPLAQTERIVIDAPATGDTVSGGTLEVRGRGLASFEQTLIVELLDEDGDVLVMEPLVVDAPDLGQPGSFAIELSYQVDAPTPARLQVRDPSPAFGGDVHLASVELTLEP